MKFKRKLLIMILTITTREFNKLIAEYFPARSAQANLTSKNDIANL